MRIRQLRAVNPGEYGPVIYLPPWDPPQLLEYDDDAEDEECECALASETELCEHSLAVLVSLFPGGWWSLKVDYEELRHLPDDFPLPPPMPPLGSVVYAVAMTPDICLSRVKIGFSKKPASRMNCYRTSNPTAMVLGWWDVSDQRAEDVALHAAGQVGARVGGEVFDFADPFGAIARISEALQRESK